MSKTNVNDFLEKRKKDCMSKILKNPSQYSMYNEYMKIKTEVLIKKFGINPNWKKISIRDKCFHGWLRPYAFPIETLINARWAYWHDICMTKEVEGKPIPKLHFYKGCDEEFKYVEEMIKMCLKVPFGSYYSDYRTFTSFIDFLLYSWGSPLVKTLDPYITDELMQHWYTTFNADLMFMFPSDYFVKIAADMYSNKNFNSKMFYPTPNSVVECMSEIVYSNIEPERAKYMSVNEPCCGSGIMLLYASNYSLRLSGQDIDLLMTKITILNGYFYVPWMVETNDEIDNLLKELHQKHCS